MIEPRTLCSFLGTIDVIGRAQNAIFVPWQVWRFRELEAATGADSGI